MVVITVFGKFKNQMHNRMKKKRENTYMLNFFSIDGIERVFPYHNLSLLLDLFRIGFSCTVAVCYSACSSEVLDESTESTIGYVFVSISDRATYELIDSETFGV